ncbi:MULTISPECIES: hypothetical protein [unclassified Rhizobium]|uniref:hypothetical protein n=1 Tax=unclassified Rhizobium TaxID=2613769 RepID=UPI0013AFA713|nr:MULTISPECIES: hypothetical protein [unclassified Rhizobium]MBB3291299.1 hypothetical protein [Rhizobium sp. BK252]MBB3406038.1 hypothetical protein [Rhizobium sp. BK289]MBB3416566.1 hypothetical protein [Rhizobium sp. BK284]MBB3486502.1 hypothetical protein [Rhizobium sp. BK347]MDK4723995.1 hypothetical protein [Rhizobium sp. CNPSo 3968]
MASKASLHGANNLFGMSNDCAVTWIIDHGEIPAHHVKCSMDTDDRANDVGMKVLTCFADDLRNGRRQTIKQDHALHGTQPRKVL